MKNYKCAVVAVELLSNNDRELIKRAEYMTKDLKANVILVHAITHVSLYIEDHPEAALEINQAIKADAVIKMRKLGERLGIPETRQIIEAGSAKALILEIAEKNKANLIIVGSHGRHGLQLLLGSTANAVLHGAKCDVLAVRLKE